MDAELAESVIDDAFEALGTPGCRYEPTSGPAVEDLRLIRHRKVGDRTRGPLSLGRGDLETTDRPEAVVVRRRDLPEPARMGVFTIGAVRLRIGEDPVPDDIHGYAWRCSVIVL